LKYASEAEMQGQITSLTNSLIEKMQQAEEEIKTQYEELERKKNCLNKKRN
jgi:hypothetical protein